MTKFIYYSLAVAATTLARPQEVEITPRSAELQESEPVINEEKADGFWNFLVNNSGEVEAPVELDNVLENAEENLESEPNITSVIIDEAIKEQPQEVEVDQAVIDAVVAAAAQLEAIEEENVTVDEPVEEQLVKEFSSDYYQMPSELQVNDDVAGYPSYYQGARRFKNQPGFWSSWDNRKTWLANWKTQWSNNRRAAYENRINNYNRGRNQRLSNLNSWRDRYANRPRPTYNWPQFTGYKTYQKYELPSLNQQDQFRPDLYPVTDVPACPTGQVWSSWSGGCISTETVKNDFYPAGHLYRGW